jgi:hypothetical protein
MSMMSMIHRVIILVWLYERAGILNILLIYNT